ncbi:hypothetical protein [Paenibacillus campi]|uniref:hypothetical protein n=1 Tax=Paenibacillus campi TaxID=3106031 RepID=UPI002AFE64E4|nr:hypothetical protein [Paenibacillus sp. SGZ-1014]
MSQRLHDWQQASTDERLQALLRIDSALQPAELQLLLAATVDVQSDDILRIEIWKVLGLYSDAQQQPTVRALIHRHWAQEQDEEYVQIAMLEALTALHVEADDIQLALSIVQSDEYILVRAAAFALLRRSLPLSQAREALVQLRDDADFGSVAVKLVEQS